VDNSPYSFTNHRNAVPILPYYSEKADRELLSLAEYLLALDCDKLLEQNEQHFARNGH